MHTHTGTLCSFRRRGYQAMHWGDRESRHEGPEVEPGLASWGAWPAGRQLENRLDSGGTSWMMDPDLKNVRMW